jgi:hypothetical protein
MLREGMEVLVGCLASVRDGWEDEDAPAVVFGIGDHFNRTLR